MKALSVSVIIVTYKQPNSLRLAIESLNSQTYGGDIEIIVTDDGSPANVRNENLNILESASHPSKYAWHADVGYRAAASRNNGIRLASNDLLIFLDGDIVPYSDLIEKHVLQHQEIGRLVAGNRTWVGEQEDVRTLDALQSIIPDEDAKRRGENENLYRHKLLASKHPWRACFSANLSVLKTSNVLFDERFFGWGPEDAEFCYRLCVKHGLKPVYDPTIGSYHLENPEAVGNVFRKNSHEAIVNYIRNTFLFYDNCPGIDLEDAFYGFKRLELDKESGKWSVIPRTQAKEHDLSTLVSIAREWLVTH